MEENNNYNNGNITPYKATGNLNTAIGNPQVNINDTMNINIQSMATNTIPASNVQNNNQVPVNNTGITANTIASSSNVTSNNNVTYATTNNLQSNSVVNNTANVVTPNIQNTNNINNQYTQKVEPTQTNNQSTSYIKKTYVSADNKPKKKNISLSLGPEFKIGLLIIVILLVFVLFLPMISDFINGY